MASPFCRSPSAQLLARWLRWLLSPASALAHVALLSYIAVRCAGLKDTGPRGPSTRPAVHHCGIAMVGYGPRASRHERADTTPAMRSNKRPQPSNKPRAARQHDTKHKASQVKEFLYPVWVLLVNGHRSKLGAEAHAPDPSLRRTSCYDSSGVIPWSHTSTSTTACMQLQAVHPAVGRKGWGLRHRLTSQGWE